MIPLNDKINFSWLKSAPKTPTETIQALLSFLKHCPQTSYAAFITQLQLLRDSELEPKIHLSSLGLIDQFIAYVHRQFKQMSQNDHISKLIQKLQQSLTSYQERLNKCQDFIAKNCEQYIRNGMTIATFGFSDTLNNTIKYLKTQLKMDFRLIVVQSAIYGTDSRTSIKNICAYYQNQCGIQPVIISEGTVYPLINQIDLIIVGAEALSLSGGLVNTLGTSQICMIAKQNKRKVIVLSQFFKFNKKFTFTFTQSGVQDQNKSYERKFYDEIVGVNYWKQPLDYTPSEYIDVIITEVGAFTTVQAAEEAAKSFKE